MLLSSLEQLRALPRAAEITRILLRFGLHDLVRSAGLHRVLDHTRDLMGWKADEAILSQPLPHRLRLALEALGPTFVKLGQVLASRVDMLPPEWVGALDSLHANATAVPFAEIEAQLLSDLGRPLEAAFESFEKTPRAAASIAQVHYAVLPGGKRVAVKVRRPGIAATIEADLHLLETLAEWLEDEEPATRRYQPRELARQLRQSISRELDFAAEARGQQRFADSFRDRPDVEIPQVHTSFTRSSLLVMDWVDGIPGTDLAKLDAAGLDRKLLAARGADSVLKMVLVDGFFHADPHPGNVFYLPGNRLALIDFGMVGWLSTQRRNELVDLLAAVASRDPIAMRDVLLGWADGQRISTERFAEDLGRLIYLYDHAALADIRLGTLLDEIAGVMREHHLALPSDLALLFKALITLEGLGAQLDPGFRLVEHVTPYVRELLHQRWDPSAVGKRLAQQTREATVALGRIPGLVGRFARQVGDDGVGLRLEIREIDKLTTHLERSVNRLAIGMITAALIVGSSIVLAVTGPANSAVLWGLGIAGVLWALFNSIWLVISIRTTRSRDR
jgi:ubiquinone biosynthesis protein